MTKKSTWEDVPNTLNSICWQLKCIAETLDSINQRQKRSEQPEEIKPIASNSVHSSKLRRLLNDL